MPKNEHLAEIWSAMNVMHLCVITCNIPDSKVHGANMGPTWVLSALDGSHISPMNLAIRDDNHANYTPIQLVSIINSYANPANDEAGMFQENYINTMAADNFVTPSHQQQKEQQH